MSADLELLHAVAVLCVVAASLLVVFIDLAAGVAARVWADAKAPPHRAHANPLHFHAAETVQEEAQEALEGIARPPRAPYVPPTEEELRQGIIAAREECDREYSTLENDGIPADQEPIPAGGMYRAPVEPPF